MVHLTNGIGGQEWAPDDTDAVVCSKCGKIIGYEDSREGRYDHTWDENKISREQFLLLCYDKENGKPVCRECSTKRIVWRVYQYHALPCSGLMVINDQHASIDWFVEVYDDESERAAQYCCEHMCAHPNRISDVIKTVKEKLGIELTLEEAEAIQDRLVSIFDVGPCGWCE